MVSELIRKTDTKVPCPDTTLTRVSEILKEWGQDFEADRYEIFAENSALKKKEEKSV